MGSRSPDPRSLLRALARRAMVDRGLWPDFSSEVQAEVRGLRDDLEVAGATGLRDLTALPWASIDNDDSRDLDQLTVAEELTGGAIRVLVAVADVDARVEKNSAIDRHAHHNTTSVYTAAQIFPMLPERLSTDLTSLNEGVKRLAVVAELNVDADGRVATSSLYRAKVKNQAQLAYNSVAEFLDGKAPAPPKVARLAGLDGQLRLQHTAAQRLSRGRHDQGALDLETLEPKPVFDGESVSGLILEHKNSARQLIEDFMIAANGATARHLAAAGLPSLRRVVRSPERWQRIVAVASELGDRLPGEPDGQALEEFLVRRRRVDPLRFPDLSLVIVKLMGAGEYAVEVPGQKSAGHFGLAVRDYTHSTAPNRRYPDLIAQRMVKASLDGRPSPYSIAELEELARQCTEREDDANKVERQVRKSAAALLLERRVGDRFDAIVTGAAPKGTWVRILQPPVEGKLVRGAQGLKVGDRLQVELEGTDVERGFIDFSRI